MTLNEKKDRLLNYIDRLVAEKALDPADASSFAEKVDSVRTDMDLLDLQMEIDKASSKTIEKVRGVQSATKAEPETGKKGGKKGGKKSGAATETGEIKSFSDVMKKGMFTPEQQKAIEQAKLQAGEEAAAAGDPAFRSNVERHNRTVAALSRKVQEIYPYADSQAKVKQLASIIAKRFAAVLPAEQQAKMAVADWQKLIHQEMQNWMERGIPEDVRPEVVSFAEQMGGETRKGPLSLSKSMREALKSEKILTAVRQKVPEVPLVRTELGLITPELTQEVLQTAGIAATPGGRFVPGITLPTTLDKTFQDAAQYAIEKGEITKWDLMRDLKLGPKTADDVLARLQEANVLSGPTGTGDLGGRRASTAAATAKTSKETYRALATGEECNTAIGSIPTSTGEPRRKSLEGSPDKLTRTTPVGTPEAEAARIRRVAIKRARLEKGLIPLPKKGDTASAVRRAVQGEIQKLAVHDMATAQATIEILKADKKFGRFIPQDIEKQLALPNISSTMPVPQDRLTFSVTARGYAEQLKGELQRLAQQTRVITPKMIEPLLGGRLPTGKVAQEVLAIWQAEGLVGEGMEHLVNLNLNKREFVQALASIANDPTFQRVGEAGRPTIAGGTKSKPPSLFPTPQATINTGEQAAVQARQLSAAQARRGGGGMFQPPTAGRSPASPPAPSGIPAQRRPFVRTGAGIFGAPPASPTPPTPPTVAPTVLGAVRPAARTTQVSVRQPSRQPPAGIFTPNLGPTQQLGRIPGRRLSQTTLDRFEETNQTMLKKYRAESGVVDEAVKEGPKTAAAESAAAGMMPTRASRLRGALRTARKHPIGTALGAAWLVPELVRGGFEVADVIRGGDERRMDKQIAHEKEMARLQMQIERLETGGGVTPDAVMRKYRLEQLVNTRAQLLAERDPGLAQILSGLPELTPNEFVVGAKPNIQALRDFIEADILRRGEDE